MFGAPVTPAVLGLPPIVEHGALLLASFGLLLVGAEVFTNAVEWLGHLLGLSESATGSVLAAVGTALPETMIPVIAILQVQLGTGSQAAADEVGVGAILGAPFMLSTIAMFMIGGSLLVFADRRVNASEFQFNHVATRRDLSFFLVGYVLAVTAALVESRPVEMGIAVALVGLYLAYLYRTLKSGEDMESEGIDELHLGTYLAKNQPPLPRIGIEGVEGTNPSGAIITVQTLAALGLIIGGAHLFVGEVEYFSNEVLLMPAAVIALILAPLATELPEKFNSIIWISEDKDTLAIGNITGAMAFQGTLPVTLGILFTSWNLSLEWGTAGFLNAFSAVLALVGGGILYLRARQVNEGRMAPYPFLAGGLFYLLFIAVVVYHVVAFDLSVAGGH